MVRHILLGTFLSVFGIHLFSQNAKAPHKKEAVQSPAYAFISRQGQLYGLGDSSGWYKNAPTGDSIFHLGNNHFAVRNSGGKYAIFNHSFRMLQRNCSLPQMAGNYIISTDSLGAHLLDIVGETNSPAYDSIYIANNYAWLYKNGKQGIKNLYWPDDSIIAPLYDKVGPYHGGVLLIQNNKLGWAGPVKIPVAYDHIYMERPNILAAVDKSGITYFSLVSNSKLNTLPTDSVVFYDHHYKRIRGNRQSLFTLDDNTPVAEIDKYSIHPFSFANYILTNDYCIVSNDSLCALFEGGNFLTGFEYQNILDNSEIMPPYFRVVQNGQVGLIDAHGAFILKPQYSDIVWKTGDVYEIRKGNLLGLVKAGDEIITPVEYSYINLYSNNYAIVSKDERHFGIFNYNSRQLEIPCKYDHIGIDSVFIIARHLNTYDIYYKSKPVLCDVYDAQIHKNTAKGYKDGKIFIGYIRNKTWEMDSYEIPSYKVQNKNKYEHPLWSGTLAQTIEMYDYAKGKWGYYNIPSQSWSTNPVAHSGDAPNDVRLLPLYTDSTTNQLGIRFKIRKGFVQLSQVYELKNAYNWLDIYPYRYLDDSKDNRSYMLSPVYFKEPGKGAAWDDYGKHSMSAAFPGTENRSVFSEGGVLQLTSHGDMSLSDYICRLSENGCTHPLGIADYEKILDPHLCIIVKGGRDHIMDTKWSGSKHISLQNSYEWVHKTSLNFPIVRQNGKYGLLSDSALFILEPRYESIEPFPVLGDIAYKVGVRSAAYRIYDTKNKSFSGLIEPVTDFKDELLVVNLGNGKKAVMNTMTDTLLITSDSVSLSGQNYFTTHEYSGTKVYRGAQKIFAHTQQATEMINPEHFLIQGTGGYMVLSTKGDTLMKSGQIIDCVFSNDNFLLDCGNTHRLYTASGKLICEFEKTRYEFNEGGDLVIREKENVRLYRHDTSREATYPGKFINLTAKYLTMKFNKTETVYNLQGEKLVTGIKNTKALNADYFTYRSGKKNMLMHIETRIPVTIRQPITTVMEDGFDYLDMSGTTQTILFRTDSVNKPYVTSQNGLYGLDLNESGMQTKTILPCQYYNIKVFGNNFLVQDHLEYKVFSIYTRTFISPESFDNVYPYRDYIRTFKKGKTGYLKD